MDMQAIKLLTRLAYDRTALKYHRHFQHEMEQKEFDRQLLDRFASRLPREARICDAGCGPSGHIGAYLAAKGHSVVGLDLSETCAGNASTCQPASPFLVGDMMQMPFPAAIFEAVVSFYSIVYTPKAFVGRLFAEFGRVLKPGGLLLVVVKQGDQEGLVDDDWYEGNPVYFTHFTEEDIQGYFAEVGFRLEYLHTRAPLDFEFPVDRVYAWGARES